ncbi:hypothetical protein [Thermocoleostomius sinensis]|uniref:Uncharacterized protein n=1 Tax=Thermocoleostomius sinensis A174 TaxID=2016057 RepID=A0A9E8ZDS5_9CYAN|nr:hypothetical protein [Thermocoleostomius sinensis]WAL59982.1 hypothetical protein OXH18_22875 [Thermocoleostomius sinensis A174]
MALFPHRYDFLYAEMPDPTEKPHWKTESRYPLSDRTIQQSTQLFGVRFGKKTAYCLLDIDTTSVYHPTHDRFAIGNIAAALEPLGLVNFVACTSSYSGGIHLYFPFQKAESSWKVAAAVTALLTQAGFKLRSGQLEVFPNAKPYVAGQLPSLFNAHRLPLQMGSYLLDAEFQPIWSDHSTFVQHWNFAKQRNHLNDQVLKQLLQPVCKPYAMSGKAEKFLKDLNTEIEMGWTGHGQTNRLLGRIAMRAYVFHHWLAGGDPLTGQALVDKIVSTARSLPGYYDWCQHQPDIEQRASEWARCVEASHYFPYGVGRRSNRSDAEKTETASTTTWNQQQTALARARIREAVARLLETNTLPTGITARFRRLTTFGISGSSLYRHRDLWHPNHLARDTDPVEPVKSVKSMEPVEDPEHTSNLTTDRNSTNLFPPSGCNPLLNQLPTPSPQDVAMLGCNLAWGLEAEDLRYLAGRSRILESSPNQVQRLQQFLSFGDPVWIDGERLQVQQLDDTADHARDYYGDYPRDHCRNHVVNQLSRLRSLGRIHGVIALYLDQFPDREINGCSDRLPLSRLQESLLQECFFPLLGLFDRLAGSVGNKCCLCSSKTVDTIANLKFNFKFLTPCFRNLYPLVAKTKLVKRLHWSQTTED